MPPQLAVDSAPTPAPAASATSPAVAILGLGYAGLTLAVQLAASGVRVLGYDADPAVREQLSGAGAPHLHEAGLAERLAGLPDGALEVPASLPDVLPPAVIVAVGTPLGGDGAPDLTALRAAVRDVADRMTPDTLIVLRSTVPVGTCREVTRWLAEHVDDPLVAFCPERTSQGIAMDELDRLPQVVGASTEEAARRAEALFDRCAPSVVRLSSLEAAEVVKLACNAHTDIRYAFGNEIARITEALGLDAGEIIAGANVDYPRPDIARPGPVGGSCLTKDPHILIHSVEPHGYAPSLIALARDLNASVPGRIADRLLEALEEAHGDPAHCDVLVCGIAFKGTPETDDVRGTAARELAELLGPRVRSLRGQDFVVDDEHIAAVGLEPVSLADGARGAHALVVLNDHANYADAVLADAVAGMARPAVVYDVWGVVDRRLSPDPDAVRYLRLGRG